MKCDCGRLISRHMHGICLACRYAKAKEASDMIKVKPKKIVSCRQCGKQFFTSNNSVRYCSESCRKKASNEKARLEGQKIITRTCMRCAAEFQVKKGSSRQLCANCKSVTTSVHTKQPAIDHDSRAEKMRKIKASGLTYGQYTSGIWPKDAPELEGTITANTLSEQWDKRKPEEEIILHPKAKIRRGVNPCRLPDRGFKKRNQDSADQRIKELDYGQKEKEEETEAGAFGEYLLYEML